MDSIRGRSRGWVVPAALAVAVLVAAVAWWNPRLSPATRARVATPDGLARSGAGGGSTLTPTTEPTSLRILAMTPADGATGVNGTSPLAITFSAPLNPATADPSLSPAVPGTWAVLGSHTLTFTPAGAFPPDATLTVNVPAGPAGVRATDGAELADPVQMTFQVAQGSVLRLQEVLSQLGYSPLSWAPASSEPASDPAAAARAAFDPPAGTFTWRNQGWPASLASAWEPGSYTAMTKGMIMAFEASQGLEVDGVAGPKVWQALLSAVALHQVNAGGYYFAVVNKNSPQSLTIWHDGRPVFATPANTGISVAPTADGTYPVYLRLRSQVMRGTNPDGSHYADPVQFVAYFNGGDAVHYMPRASYGDPQSLGCVELPLPAAATAWSYLPYGSLVSVIG